MAIPRILGEACEGTIGADVLGVASAHRRASTLLDAYWSLAAPVLIHPSRDTGRRTDRSETRAAGWLPAGSSSPMRNATGSSRPAPAVRRPAVSSAARPEAFGLLPSRVGQPADQRQAAVERAGHVEIEVRRDLDEGQLLLQRRIVGSRRRCRSPCSRSSEPPCVGGPQPA